MKKNFISVIVLLLLFSCGTKQVPLKELEKEKTVRNNTSKNIVKTKPQYKNATEAYIAEFSQVAIDEMRRYNIPASITLAQGILESASGQGRLATKANNHFGIKCHKWKGSKIYHDDDELQECFRKYNFAGESFRDHSEFLTSRSRYDNLFKLKPNDYKAWAKGLKAAGYATDKKYPDKLIGLIERYKLYEYDTFVLKGTPVSAIKPAEIVNVHVVKKGDTLYSISKRYKISVTNLKKWNNLEDNILQIGQELTVK